MHAPVLKQKALQCFQHGQLKKAKTLYEKICRQYPQDAEAWYMLASVYGQSGHYRRAADYFIKTLRLQPNAVIAHCGLGSALKQLGQQAEAEHAFRQALKIQPDMTDATLELAGILLAQGKSAEAEKLLLDLTRKNPQCAEAFHGLGEIAGNKGQLDDAIRYYRKTLELKPERAKTHNRLGSMLHYKGQMDEAIACFEKAISLNADFPEAFRNMGASLLMSGRLDEAESCCDRAIRRRPDDIDTLVQKATIHERKGDPHAAYSVIKPLLENRSLHTGIAILYGEICRKIGHCDEAILYLERVLAHDGITGNIRQRMHYTLGNLLDKQQSYDDAFNHFSKANMLAADAPAAAEHSAIVSGIMDTFDWGFLSAAPRASVESNRPVFIVGMPRSGTSLLEQIVSSHPDVQGAGEQAEIGDYAGELAKKLGPVPGYPMCYRNVSQQHLDHYARRYLEKLGKISDSTRFVTDKMPQNFIHLGLIALLFPGARIIHCCRDPIDTCLSIYFQNFSYSHSYATRLENIAYYYLDYTRLMNHWKAVIKLPLLDVRYDDLIINPEPVTKGILDFIGLDWAPQCLKFYESRRAVSTASYDQVRQPLYTDSLHRWKLYEKHIGVLRDILAPLYRNTET